MILQEMIKLNNLTKISKHLKSSLQNTKFTKNFVVGDSGEIGFLDSSELKSPDDFVVLGLYSDMSTIDNFFFAFDNKWYTSACESTTPTKIISLIKKMKSTDGESPNWAELNPRPALLKTLHNL